MCDTNAWSDKSCGHSYDTLDREIMIAILYASMRGRCLTRRGIATDIANCSPENSYIPRDPTSPWAGQLISNRLQVLKREGYIKPGYWTWDATDKLKRAYTDYQRRQRRVLTIIA